MLRESLARGIYIKPVKAKGIYLAAQICVLCQEPAFATARSLHFRGVKVYVDFRRRAAELRKPFEMSGARKRTRTSKAVRPLEPESSASASSATWALSGNARQIDCARRGNRCQRGCRAAWSRALSPLRPPKMHIRGLPGHLPPLPGRSSNHCFISAYFWTASVNK